MTVEEQKYVEECRKKLGPEQVQVIQMAFKYGLGIKDVRRLAIPKLNAEQMRQTVYAVLENVDSELIELCCQGTFDQYQIPEIVSGSVSGLTKEEILSYATPDLPASRMKKMRSQLIEAKKNASDTAEGTAFREYTENLIKMMETSLQQFKENNEKFEVLSSLVKEHVLDEKNQEIKDLYDNLKEKDNLIKKLQEEAAGREAQIKDLEAKLSDVKVQTVQGAEKSIHIGDRSRHRQRKKHFWISCFHRRRRIFWTRLQRKGCLRSSLKKSGLHLIPACQIWK